MSYDHTTPNARPYKRRNSAILGPAVPALHVPVYDDPVRKLMGDPPPGMSALDRRAMRMDLDGVVAPFAVDWSKIRITDKAEHRASHLKGGTETDETGTPLEGDIDVDQ